METLIARWKSSSNVSRYSEKKQQHQQRTGMASSSSPSSSSGSRRKKSAQKGSPIKMVMQSGSKYSESKERKPFQRVAGGGDSGKKNSTMFRYRRECDRQSSQLIDLSSYQIVQLTKQHLPSHQLTEQVKQVLADMAEQVLLSAGGGQQQQVMELQSRLVQQERQMQILKSAQSSVRDDLSRKLVSELEERLVSSEREKLKVTQQRDKLQSKLDQLLSDVSKLQGEEELFRQLRKDNELLSQNNRVLLQQLEQMQDRDQQQQNLWNQQVDDLLRMMDILKAQLQDQK